MPPSFALPLSTIQVAAAVFIGVLSLGAGTALVVDAVRTIRFRRRAREEFVRVDATVVDSAVHEPATAGPDAQSVPHVEYQYVVDDETYRSRSLWPTAAESPDRVPHGVARRIVEDHPVEAEVIARYDPDDPTTAYLLDQFDDTGERIELTVGALLIATFLALVTVVVGTGI